jgi:thiol-disulfide isomerase/thioredoxin
MNKPSHRLLSSARLLPALILLAAACSLRCAGPRQLPALGGLEVIHGDRPDPATTRIILAEFWAAWCGPCLESIDHLNELQEAFRKEGLVVLGVAVEDNQTLEEARNVAKEKIKYTVLWDAKARMALKYRVEGYPTAFLLDTTYRVLWEGHPADLTEEKIRDLLGKAAK